MYGYVVCFLDFVFVFMTFMDVEMLMSTYQANKVSCVCERVFVRPFIIDISTSSSGLFRALLLLLLLFYFYDFLTTFLS